ncbi:predicted protein [Postia placenta Mad-698-R]|nr:predicted protein [Postia placenta Mad-698-R]
MAVSMPLTHRTSSMSTLQKVPLLSSLPASSSCAPTALPDPLRRITNNTKLSEGPNTRLALAAPSHPDQPLDIPVLSPLALAYPGRLPPVPSLSSLPRGCSRTRSPRSLPSRQPQPPPPPLGCPPSPPLAVVSSSMTLDKETLKHLLPLQYDRKTVIKCNCFLSQLLIYWHVNTALSTIELKVQVTLSLLDGDAHTWATPIFAQLASVSVGVQGAVTLFTNVKVFLTAFKGRFDNLNDTTSVQVELTKVCADKSMCEKCTATEFSTLFKGPVDHSGYSDPALHDKYLSGIPSCVYRKIELETFATWTAADKHTMEVEQQLDISWAHWPELNSFFSAQEGEHSGACGGAPRSQGTSASINAVVGKGDFPAVVSAAGSKGTIILSAPTLVCAQHADVALGAVDNNMSVQAYSTEVMGLSL